MEGKEGRDRKKERSKWEAERKGELHSLQALQEQW